MVEAPPWDPTLLTPVLITYNRAGDLAATLEQWAGGAAAGANLVILDNASTDATAAVVDRFRSRLPNLAYVRNPCNVGGAANILRAAEHCRSAYLWVIGDDDRWSLEDLTELVAVLRAGAADLVRLGWLVQEGRGRTLPARDLAMVEPLFFPSVSLISSVVVRRRLVIDHLPMAYQGVSDAYPHLVPMLRAFEEGALLVHSLERDLVVHAPSTRPGYFLGDLEWFSLWFRTGRYLDAPEWRAAFCRSILHYVTRKRPSWLARALVLPMNALRYKVQGLPQGAYLSSLLGFGVGCRLNVLVAGAGYFLLPRFLAHWLDTRYRAWAELKPPPTLEEQALRRRTRVERL